MTEPRYTRLVASLPATVPFVGPETQERARGARFRARIGANESVFGPSPMAVEAIRAAAGDLWMYCDPENYDLKAALATYHGVGAENVVVGEGIDGLLGLAVRLLAEPGDAIVTSLGAYPTFNFHVAGFGARLVTVPYRDDREDWPALIEAARRERAKLIYLANPDNPMGSWWSADAISELMDAVPAGSVLLLDEAYGELAPRGTLPPFDTSNAAVLRLRTFSKAFGLAGLRVGYAIGEAGLVRSFDKIRNHFGVTRLGQVGALAALADRAHLERVSRLADEGRRRVAAIAVANGLKPLPSATNFVAVDCGRDGAFARKVLAALVASGVFIRMPGVAPLDRCIRIGCGLEPDMAVLAEELPRALAQAASGP
jgi:histidinol-phosphate aminotransferase